MHSILSTPTNVSESCGKEFQPRYAELKKTLDPQKLIREARRQSGLNEFGSEHFFQSLNTLLDCAAIDVDFSDTGLINFRHNIIRCLINRLRMHRDFTLHPEIRDEDVSDPIVVIGLPRTGTTKIQRILSSLPETEIQKTYLWKMMNPAPFSRSAASESDYLDPRIAAASQGGITSDGRPDYQAAHIATAMEPEEDGLMCDGTFDDWVWSSVLLPSTSYYDWVIERPHINNYKHLHTMYQYLQWQNGGKQNRPWVTKNVQHIAYLEELLSYFPKATLVHCHRTPVSSIPSLVKLTIAMWSSIVKEVDPVFTGQTLLNWWQSAMDKYLLTRDKLHLDHRILDIPYDRIRNDAVNVATEVYRNSNRVLSPENIQTFRDWDRSNEQHMHGKHSYSLQQFGLSETMISKAFEGYIERFIAK
ncbi:sulfotransferase family protein [Dasania marina]|uniref:sulfotransferase family protein n=1 Tax=Dasania marina TaxID=471499 RepID=UPI00035C2EB0|nr:sulfotransferase [Dasania marina]